MVSIYQRNNTTDTPKSFANYAMQILKVSLATKKQSNLNFLQTNLFEVFISAVVKLRLAGGVFRITLWHTDNHSLSCSRKQYSVGINLVCLAFFGTDI